MGMLSDIWKKFKMWVDPPSATTRTSLPADIYAELLENERRQKTKYFNLPEIENRENARGKSGNRQGREKKGTDGEKLYDPMTGYDQSQINPIEVDLLTGYDSSFTTNMNRSTAMVGAGLVVIPEEREGHHPHHHENLTYPFDNSGCENPDIKENYEQVVEQNDSCGNYEGSNNDCPGDGA